LKNFRYLFLDSSGCGPMGWPPAAQQAALLQAGVKQIFTTHKLELAM
jgi:hypothetical protein